MMALLLRSSKLHNRSIDSVGSGHDTHTYLAWLTAGFALTCPVSILPITCSVGLSAVVSCASQYRPRSSQLP